MSAADVVELEFTGEVWEWRGPAPFHFVSVPVDLCDDVRDAAEIVSHGWGMVPVTLRIGATEWTTSLWPKAGGYVMPLKVKVRRAESVELGDIVTVCWRFACTCECRCVPGEFTDRDRGHSVLMPTRATARVISWTT